LLLFLISSWNNKIAYEIQKKLIQQKEIDNKNTRN
jgi:hypothetical protein